ncbi:hypothetical protein [Perlucidibaca piscinae]|uniref:hypothetical protein n=1 Tax=Perlucidibaca piscinae TaxID=392589 RepID=UPI0004253FF0|nr:hypothetical protein [Perlucidibaca piscinae]
MMPCRRHNACTTLLLGLLVLPALAAGDGLAIDRVYEPAVTALERELEMRTLLPSGARDSLTLGYGQSVAERVAIEGYVTLSGEDGRGLDVAAWEAELRWQLSETGEYALDWGLLLESEYERDERTWENSVSVIASHQAPRWTGTVNLALAYEAGPETRNEFDTSARGQWRYRWHPLLEPGLEVHVGETTRAIGPMLAGRLKLSPRQRLNWEVAALAGVSDDTPDATLRTLLEWEF